MWKQHKQFFRHPSNGRQGRPIKTVPKSTLLAAIEQSKKTVPMAQPVIHVNPEHVPTFDQLALHGTLLANISAKGFSTPTPIQQQAIPAILDQKDIIGIANTGTGKTAAFLIPLIQKITCNRAQRVLILAPTRELAFQIHNELRELSHGLSIRSAMLVGGGNEWRQEQDIRRDPHVVIATPGRLKDFIESKRIRLSGFRNIVLDEADRMVDIGFINDIKYFISLIPKERQSLFFSATISGRVNEIIADFVHDPIRITVTRESTPGTIIQDVVKIPQNQSKMDTLHNLLLQENFKKVLLFGRTKHGVQRLSDEMEKRGIKSGAIHGNKRQNQRQHILAQFTKNELQLLCATDVASRGLDIPIVSHVINYDLPETMEDYTHRIGRTGRANNQGVALTFIE